MKLLSAAALVAAFSLFGTPAFAKEDCDAGFKTHMSKMSVYVDKVSGHDLSDAIRKSLDAYGSCNAGDTLTQHGVWDQILADMEAKAKAAK